MTQRVSADDTTTTPTETPSGPPHELLTAARELVRERGGVDVALGRLSMEEVCQRAGLSRSTAYRQWRNRQEFVLDVAHSLAAPQVDEPSPTRVYRELIAARLEDLETASGREQLASDLFMLIGEHEIRYARTYSPALMIVRLASASDPARDERVTPCNVAARWESRLVTTVDECLHILGFSWLPGHTSAGFARTVMALAHGTVGLSYGSDNVDAESTQTAAFSVASIFSAHTVQNPQHDARQALASFLRALATAS